MELNGDWSQINLVTCFTTLEMSEWPDLLEAPWRPAQTVAVLGRLAKLPEPVVGVLKLLVGALEEVELPVQVVQLIHVLHAVLALHGELGALGLILAPGLCQLCLEQGDAGLGVAQVGLQKAVLTNGSFKPLQQQTKMVYVFPITSGFFWTFGKKTQGKKNPQNLR